MKSDDNTTPDKPRRVLITGAAGLLGTALRQAADTATVEIWSVIHQRPVSGNTIPADLTSRNATLEAVQTVAPDLVIHAAYDKTEAGIVGATEHLVTACQRAGLHRLIHLSSESVFAGGDSAYREWDEPTPTDDYGRWKRFAEQLVLAQHEQPTVVRLPLVVSIDPPSPDVKRVLEAGRVRATPGWFIDEWRPPAWAAELAAAIWRLAQVGQVEPPPIVHLPGAEVLSRWEIAQRIGARLGLDPTSIGRPIQRPSTRGAPRRLSLDGSLARTLIDWRPSPL